MIKNLSPVRESRPNKKENLRGSGDIPKSPRETSPVVVLPEDPKDRNQSAPRENLEDSMK
jgi:hypothetical protein